MDAQIHHVLMASALAALLCCLVNRQELRLRLIGQLQCVDITMGVPACTEALSSVIVVYLYRS